MKSRFPLLVRTLWGVQYLSSEWLAAANRAVQEAAASAPSGRLVIDQRVDGASHYRVIIMKDASSVGLIGTDAPPADAAFRQSLETATAVAQGTTDAHQAFLLGHITFEGDINILIEQRAAFDWLQTALAPLLATTSF